MTVRRRTIRWGPRASSRRGFSLVELIVVIAIIVLVLGIATPSLVKMLQGTKETRARNLFRGLMTNGRAYAMNNGRYAGYRFQRCTYDNRTYAILIEHDPGLQIADGNDNDQRVQVYTGDESDNRSIAQSIRQSLTGTPPVLAFYAVGNVKPIAFPSGIGFLQDELGTIASRYEETTNDDLKGDRDDPSKPMFNATSFSVLFDPKGRPAQIYHVVRRRSEEDQADKEGFDSIFNDEEAVGEDKTALLYMDGPAGGQFTAEMAQVGVRMVDERGLDAVDADRRWEDGVKRGYVQKLPRWRLNLYSGVVVDMTSSEAEG